jgi:hypothetical protein
MATKPASRKLYETAETVRLYEKIPTGRWIKTTDIDKMGIDLTSRGIRHALGRLEQKDLIKKNSGGGGLAGEVYKLETNDTLKSHKQKAREEPAGFYMTNGYEISSCNLNQADSIFIHRLVAISEYGFDAVADSHIHHINSIPWDNRPSNLVPLPADDHRRRESLRSSIENAADETLATALEVKGYYDAAEAVGGSNL